MIITIIAFIFVFGLLVFSHELGHFLAARLFGVEVKTFAFGFPPRIWSKKVGATTYAINAIPLGGYVNLLGEDELDTDNTTASTDERSLLSKKPWQLIVVFLSGVFMNLVLAVLLFFICYLVGFRPIANGMTGFSGIKDSLHVSVTQVEKGAPAEAQGVKVGDSITSVDGNKTSSASDVITAVSRAKVSGKNTVKVVLGRGDETLTKEVSTYEAVVGGQKTTRIGITLEDRGVLQGDLLSSFTAAFQVVFGFLALTVTAILGLFSSIITSFKVTGDVSGPVGIVLATSYFANLGITALLQFAAVLSLSLAVFNILPIPGLDGGHVVFSFLEMITRKRISQKVKNTTSLIGFGLLMLLMLAVTVKDFITFDIIGMIKGMF